MSDPKEVVRRIEEAWDRDDYQALEGLIAADIVSHDAPPGFPSGFEGAKFGHGVFRASFPDARHEITQLFGEGELVTVCITTTATHTGEPFLGVPSANKPVRVDSISVYRVNGGRAVEHWGINDAAALFAQLGALERPSAPARA